LCDAINDTQQEAFDTLAERYGLDEQHSHLLSGVPYRVIEDFARQHAFDLMVLGICHHRALNGFGGTAECLMNRAPCSLLMVKAMPATA
jgi:universal stress protein E